MLSKTPPVKLKEFKKTKAEQAKRLLMLLLNMMPNKIILITVITIASVSCRTTKKQPAVQITTTPVTTPPTNTTASVFSVAKSFNGIYPPGNEELIAIQAKYKDVTHEKLNKGYQLYTQGACVGCRAFNIYSHDEQKWKTIIDNMAVKANISEEEKDAVHKYVLSIKATQPK